MGVCRHLSRGHAAPARLYADDNILEQALSDRSRQLVNTATLPGIVGYAMAMPDASGLWFPWRRDHASAMAWCRRAA